MSRVEGLLLQGSTILPPLCDGAGLSQLDMVSIAICVNLTVRTYDISSLNGFAEPFDVIHRGIVTIKLPIVNHDLQSFVVRMVKKIDKSKL